VGFREEATQVGISSGRLGQERHVVPTFGFGVTRETVPERHLGAGDGLDPGVAGGVGELHGAVETVVVREGQRRIVQLHGPTHQLLRVGGTVEE
jgi:hypothetical protein